MTINIPLVEAINKIPTYEKFMKKFMTKKRALECEMIDISHSYSAILTRRIAAKRDDSGAFTICAISKHIIFVEPYVI